MRLPIESWLESSDASEQARDAFRESMTCYKSGAYRAALLFAYVGACLWLRRRLLTARRPPDYPEGKWLSLQKALKNDKTWEEKVFTCTQVRTQGLTVFVVEDHIRDEFKYWRDRRNDCAHFRRGEIDAAHVESFWWFLRSRMGRWVPNGGARDLAERFARHFDPDFTSPAEDVTPLALMVGHAAAPDGLPDLFSSIAREIFSAVGDYSTRAALADIHDALLLSPDRAVARASFEWLLEWEEIFLQVLRKNPSHVVYLEGRAERVRNLWKSQLFTGRSKDLAIVAALLRHRLIPREQIPEALREASRKLCGSVPSGLDAATLCEEDFWEHFDDYAFAQRKADNFGWGNRNARLIAWRVEKAQVTPVIAQSICGIFAEEPFPFAVRNALRDMLAANPLKMEELRSTASSLELSIPPSLEGDDTAANPR